MADRNVDITAASYRVIEILRQERSLTDGEIAELRTLSGAVDTRTTYWDVAHFRMNVELLAAIRSFDKASANLITTTNKLTERILMLTCVAIGLGLISVIPVVRDLINFFAGK